MTTHDPLQPTPRGSTPVPDPTKLTDRAIDRLDKSMRKWVKGQLKVRDERLRGIDTATKHRLTEVTATHAAVPGAIAAATGSLEKLMNEKFDALERLRVEQKKDTKDAVDAALNAAKEAVKEQTAASEKAINKSEQSTGSEIASLRRELGDLKDREVEDVRTLRGEITAVASTANGQAANKAGAKEDRTGLYATIGLAISLILAAIVVVTALGRV